MNKKHKGYQDYIISNRELFEKFLKNKLKNERIQKFYDEIKVRIVNLKLIPNIKIAKKNFRYRMWSGRNLKIYKGTY